MGFLANDSQEDKIRSLDKRLQEEELLFTSLNEEVDAMLKTLGVTKEQIRILLEDKSQFSDEDWQRLETLKQELDQKKHPHLHTINDPRKTDKARSSLKEVRQNWIPI